MMLRNKKLLDPEKINFPYHWRRRALERVQNYIDEARQQESERQRHLSEVEYAVLTTGNAADESHLQSTRDPDPLEVAEAVSRFMIATADSATQSVEALQELLHNLRVLLQMDIAFVAEFVGGEKTYRFVDHADEKKACVKVNDSVPRETTLCQRVVDNRLPSYLCNAQLNPEMVNVTAIDASKIKAYLTAPVVLRDGRIYGTLCCISHTPRSALGSRQIDSLRYVAGIVAKELEKNNSSNST